MSSGSGAASRPVLDGGPVSEGGSVSDGGPVSDGGSVSEGAPVREDGVALEALRWWHIDDLMSIEADLFGAEQWSAAMFWNELANGNYYLIARSGDEIVGYAGLSVGDREAWVQNIAVRRDRQHAGIGRRLLDALLAEAHRRGVRSVLLEVAVDNAPAQRLYHGYGFEQVGLRRGYYQPSNTDALVMRRDG